MIGSQIEQYRIDAKLGEGGMGVVYLAMDLELERPVALKFLHQGLAENPELLLRFRAEARAQAKINHHNISTLYGLLVWQSTAIMVMEYIDGETLQAMVAQRGPIPAQIAVPLFRQALQGLAAAHRHGIIHRDLKPANLMLNLEGVVKVMDFGIAKVEGSASLTRSHAAMGTSRYMAPEQIRGRSVDVRTDIYSMGVTLYELLAGQVPFLANSEFDIQNAHVQQIPESPTVHYPHIPAPIVEAVMKALEKAPQDRFQTVADFLHALPDHLPAPAASTPQPVPATPRRPDPVAVTPPAPPPVAASLPPSMRAANAPPAFSLPLKVSAPAEFPDARAAPFPEPGVSIRSFVDSLLQKAATTGRVKVMASTATGALVLLGLFAWMVHRPAVEVADSSQTLAQQNKQSAPEPVLDTSPGPMQPAPGNEPGIGGAAPTEPVEGAAPTSPGTGRSPANTNQPPPPTSAAPAPAVATAVVAESGQELTGSWSGAYMDSVSLEKTTVRIRMKENAPDQISGTVVFEAANGTSGSCQLGRTKYNPQKRELLLSIERCTGGQQPAYFNVPTRFSNVDPVARSLERGEVLYLRTNVAATLSKD